MSMNLSVYVGPYLIVEGVSNELIEKHEDTVACGQGAARDSVLGIRYLIPNVDIGIERQLSFGRHESPSMPMHLENQIGPERHILLKSTMKIRKSIDDCGGSWSIAWGVVCGVF